MITPEQWQAVERDGIARLEDPETRRDYVLLPVELYERVRVLFEADPSDRAPDEFQPSDAYAALDETFRPGWDDPKMAEYDDYETHRP